MCAAAPQQHLTGLRRGLDLPQGRYACNRVSVPAERTPRGVLQATGEASMRDTTVERTAFGDILAVITALGVALLGLIVMIFMIFLSGMALSPSRVESGTPLGRRSCQPTEKSPALRLAASDPAARSASERAEIMSSSPTQALGRRSKEIIHAQMRRAA